MSTRVKFIIFHGDVVALFPDEQATLNGGHILSYEKIGQHGPAGRSLMRCKKATREQYAPLLKELVSIGYDDLKIMNEGSKK